MNEDLYWRAQWIIGEIHDVGVYDTTSINAQTLDLLMALKA